MTRDEWMKEKDRRMRQERTKLQLAAAISEASEPWSDEWIQAVAEIAGAQAMIMSIMAQPPPKDDEPTEDEP